MLVFGRRGDEGDWRKDNKQKKKGPIHEGPKLRLADNVHHPLFLEQNNPCKMIRMIACFSGVLSLFLTRCRSS